jgi:hypothetical protein
MGNSLNHGLTTSAKGMSIQSVRITGLNVASPTVAEDCRSGIISSISKTGTGVYQIQLATPWAPRLIACLCDLSTANGAGALLRARYRQASYNSTTGQFIIDISSAVPAAADGGAADELHLIMTFRRYGAF